MEELVSEAESITKVMRAGPQSDVINPFVSKEADREASEGHRKRDIGDFDFSYGLLSMLKGAQETGRSSEFSMRPHHIPLKSTDEVRKVSRLLKNNDVHGIRLVKTPESRAGEIKKIERFRKDIPIRDERFPDSTKGIHA